MTAQSRGPSEFQLQDSQIALKFLRLLEALQCIVPEEMRKCQLRRTIGWINFCWVRFCTGSLVSSKKKEKSNKFTIIYHDLEPHLPSISHPFPMMFTICVRRLCQEWRSELEDALVASLEDPTAEVPLVKARGCHWALNLLVLIGHGGCWDDYKIYKL